jgi:hypothetical protein
MRSAISYFDFDLLIRRTESGYRAHVLSSPEGQATADFTAPFSEMELENFLLKLGRPRRGTRRIDSPEMEVAKRLGGRLYEAVFSGDLRACWRASVGEAEAQGIGLRLRLRIADAPELNEIPWEYLYNAQLNQFVSLSVYTPLIRYIDLPERIRPLAVDTPLKILVMISSPTDPRYAGLDVTSEWSRLNEALTEPKHSGQVELDLVAEATLSALRRKLRGSEYHILHFIGHGGFDRETQEGVLVLCDEAGRGRVVAAQRLGTILRDHRSLRVVVLNACEGARATRADPFSGVAQTLVQQGVPAVIAMQFEIIDQAAITFASEFYSAIADGYPVDAALSEARLGIHSDDNDIEWGTPVLYLRAPDGRLFSVNRDAPRQAEEEKRRAEPGRQAEEEKQRAEATRQAEEREQQAEAARLAKEREQQAEVARQATEEKQRVYAARRAEEEKRQAEAARLAKEREQQAEVARQATEEKQRVDAARRAEEEKRQAEAARQAAERRRKEEAARQAEGLEQRRAEPAQGAEDKKRQSDRLRPSGCTLSGHHGNIFSVIFLPDGTRALSGSGDSTVRLWDLRTGSELRRFGGYKGGIFSLAIFPDGRRALSGSGDGTVRVLDLETASVLRQFDCKGRAVNSLAVLPDGRRALFGSHDRTVSLWDLETGSEHQRFKGHSDAVMSVALLPGGRRALSGSRDKTILLWDLESGSCLNRFEGHTGWVLSVTATQGGRGMLSGSGDHTLRLWDVETGAELTRFESQEGSVNSVAASPDGLAGLSGSADGIVHLWI